MKRISALLFLTFIIVATSFSQAKAATGIFVSKDDVWFLAGYNQNVAGEKGVTQSYGPIQGTVGGDIGRFFAMELQLGGRIGNDNLHKTSVYRVDNKLSIFDAKLYVMFQPKFAVPGIALRPYIGIAPTFHFSKTEIDTESPYEDFDKETYEDKQKSFDFGFAAKAGLRMQLVKFLMIGVNVEYQFHKTNLTYKDKVDYDMSGFSVGAEVGVSF